jgi:plasmid maintenance system antidote protein VapI
VIAIAAIQRDLLMLSESRRARRLLDPLHTDEQPDRTAAAPQRLGAAAHLPQLAAEVGLSQEELAERMGTTASVISRLENGQHSATIKTLQRIAAALETRLVVGFAEEQELEEAAEVRSGPELAAV